MLAAIPFRSSTRTDAWIDGELAVGCKLVSMLPEDRYDTQPVASPSGRYVVVADLRIDDRADLARDLGLLPSELPHTPDSLLASHCLDRWHEAAFERLVGVFAIAAWDRQERRMILARDFMGSRPLFYHVAERLVAFASMPSGLHALADIPKAPDYQSMAEVLAFFQPRTERSHYQGVKRVMPGHYCVIAEGGADRQTRFWRPNLEPMRLKSHDAYVEGLLHHLDQAVEAQLRGAGDNVGSHLSSGFDSTAVTTSAARLLHERGGRVTAFTGCPREGFSSSLGYVVDEGPLAAATAALHPNIEHVVVRPRHTALDEIDRASTLYGGALFNLSNMRWIEGILDEASRRNLKVILTGAMGNASLSYDGSAALAELFSQGRILEWLGLVNDLRRGGFTRWRGAIWNTLTPWLPGPVYTRLLDFFGFQRLDMSRYTSLRPDRLMKLYEHAREEGVGPRLGRQTLDYFNRPRRHGQTARLGIYTVDNGAIFKGMLGWWGVDYRDPSADRRLVEYSLRIPTVQFIYKGNPRAVIRHALAGRAPAEMLSARRKGLQSADWHEDVIRMRDRLQTEVEHMAERADTAELIDVERLQRLVRDWPSEGWESEEMRADYRMGLLRAVSVANFVRRASGANY